MSGAEAVVGSAIAAIILTVLSGTVVQLLDGVALGRTSFIAKDEALRVAQTIAPDIQMAESTSLADGTYSDTITVTYTSPSTGASTSVTFAKVGTTLERSVNGGPARAVARNVTAVSFSRSGSLFTVSVTIRPEDNASAATTSTWRVYRRPTG